MNGERYAWLIVAILSLPFFVFATRASGEPTALPQLSGWSEDLDLLAVAGEKELFSSLHGDAARQAFLQQFWEARDPFPQTSRNELREAWEERLATARESWGSLRDDRSRVFLLRGEPSSRFAAQCPQSGSFEVWVYEPVFREKYRFALVFRPGADGPWTLWQPGSSPDPLAAATSATVTPEACSNREKLSQEARWLRELGPDNYSALLERALARPQPREWLSTFQALGTAAPAQAHPLAADLQVEFAGLQGDAVVVRLLVFVSPSSLPAGPPASGTEFSIAGAVLRSGKPSESFRFRLHGRQTGDRVPLVFERALTPGDYRLRLRVEHLESGSALTLERDLAVPRLESAAAGPAAPGAPEVARALAEADAALSARRPELRLLAPPGPLLIGKVYFPVRIEQTPDLPAGERIERVVFTLDGKPLLTRNRPPFDLSLDLGPVPRSWKLRAEGVHGKGEVVARDEALINAGAQRFQVRLREPRPGAYYRRSLRLRAEVTPPPGATVERVEFWWGEDRIATLYQPPYSQPFVLPREGETGDVRAIAYLAGGASAEDVTVINTSGEPDKIDVRMVELYATVMDGEGRPVTGELAAETFVVMEDGVRQEIRQVEHAENTPVRVVTLIDSSYSMTPQMETTRQAALGFLRSLLRPQDQAAVIAFNNSPQIAVPLTADLGRLEEGLRKILAEGDTALYDSLVYSLLYLTGTKGQRAVLLLTDGADRTSRLSFEATLEAVRRTGIAVYAIGLGLEGGPRGEAGQRLKRLAAITGGKSFFPQDASRLPEIYRQIEKELRAQYRIAYQSSNLGTDGAFRTIQLQMKARGMDARTISGYYP